MLDKLLNLDQLVSIDEGTEEKGDQWLDNLLYLIQADLWTEFCLKTSGSDVFFPNKGRYDFFDSLWRIRG